MHNNPRRNHMIDLLFPVALFFVFTVSAVVVILLATRIYQSTTEASMLSDSSRTSLAYVSEKIHQNDCLALVELGTFDGCDALIITHSGEQEGYTTYIYVHENELKELLVKNGVTATASIGKTIMQVEHFLMEEIDSGLFRFSCTDSSGQRVSTLVGLHSTSER